jgi:Protein of unknown function (DUF1800)
MHCKRGSVVVLMCLILLSPDDSATARASEVAASGTGVSRRPPYGSAQIKGDQLILHALNRFTFGPRRGDLDDVRSMGLDHWFEQQLHPAQIDNSNLNARLAAYPAMQRTTEDLFRRLPSSAIIRQVIAGRVAVPETTILHAVYQDAMYRMGETRQQKAGTQEAMTARGNGADSGMDAEAARMDSAGKEKVDVRSGIDAALMAAVLSLPPAQRIARIVTMQPADATSFFQSLQGSQRPHLLRECPPN